MGFQLLSKFSNGRRLIQYRKITVLCHLRSLLIDSLCVSDPS